MFGIPIYYSRNNVTRHKNTALSMALVITVAMVLGSFTVGAFAEEPTSGTITVNSPIIGAQYSAYKVFELSMDNNENPSAFSYTIDTESPFYKAVASYAEANPTELKLDEIMSERVTTDGTITYQKFNIDGKTLDAQKFGKWLRDRLADDYGGDDKITGATAIAPTYETGETEVTVAKADAIDFENLEWGYYLITNNYDDPKGRTTVTLKLDENNKWELTAESTAAEIEAAAQAYAQAKYPDLAAAEAYVTERANQFEKTWADMTDAEKQQVLTDLQNSTKADAIAQVNNALAAAASDDNAQPITERFVFVDSTTPNAVINEKNEVDKWDVPVNPDGSADLPDIPDHDEPEGGKNIIVGETTDGKTVYGDTTETNIGDEVHYQLSINAVNYERITDTESEYYDDYANQVLPIEQYVIADYQNKNMEFVKDKKLIVTIVKKDKDGNITDTIATMDYTSWAEEGYFFTNTANTDLGTGEVFNGTGGIVIPWIEEITEAQAAERTNVTTRTVNKMVEGDPVYQRGEEPFTQSEDGETYVDANGHLVDDRTGYLLDENGDPIPETETKYFASIYPNDVTILVDYYMTLTDTATIDGAGNVNYSQYGVDYFTPEDVAYNPATPDSPPDEPQEPTEEKEKDDATVFTYAIAIKKVDDEGNNLAGAKFQLRGVTAERKEDGWYKVSAYDHNATDFGTELVTDDNGILVVEGLPTKWAIEVQETEAPAGYNKLTGTQLIEPVKTGSEMTTTSKVTYTDENGNVTESTTTTTVYKNAAGDIVAKMVKVGDDITYYIGESTKTDETTFNTTVRNWATVDKTEITKPANIAELEIENKKGTELPSTGGIGTTIFYVVGAILVLGAGIVLITRRRMDA